MKECKGCTQRALGCHSTCEDYAEYRREIKRIAELKRLDNEATAFYAERNKTTMAFFATREGGTPK